MPLVGAIEAGGTKFLCAVGEDPGQPRDIRRFATSPTNPAETVRELVDYFQARPPVAAIGISCFGPLDLRTGTLTTTPKLAWQNYPLRAAIERGLNVPVVVDTDVNGAAIGEALCGAGRGAGDFVYMTVGTGIGGAAIVHGKPVHGAMHPEMGHMVMEHHREDHFAGNCPFHGACLEGLASGPAMRERWGQPAETLAADHAAWDMAAFYLSQACVNLACILSTNLVLLGGGVMAQPGLLEKVRTETKRRLNRYLAPPRIEIPGLPYPALTGALAMAQEALR